MPPCPLQRPGLRGGQQEGFWEPSFLLPKRWETNFPSACPGFGSPGGKREPPLVDIPNVREEKVLDF